MGNLSPFVFFLVFVLIAIFSIGNWFAQGLQTILEVKVSEQK